MAMFVVMLLDEAHRPLPGGVVDRRTHLIGNSGRYFRCAEQRLGEGVVIAHPWTPGRMA